MLYHILINRKFADKLNFLAIHIQTIAYAY